MNEVMRRILVFQTVDINYGLASAMAWLYFGIILAAIAVVTFIVNKFVYYEVD
jgi:ABC-type sugar transport system permease subunit